MSQNTKQNRKSILNYIQIYRSSIVSFLEKLVEDKGCCPPGGGCC